MKINEIIQRVKDYHYGLRNGQPIDETTTRDKILYGNPDQECTGIVTTCYASMDVLRKAKELGANLVICHEALFWNHGDHREWLEESQNSAYLLKKQFLDETQIVVWRDHDYIHSGIPMENQIVDGIFYGVMMRLGWRDYLISDVSKPMMFQLPATTAEKLGQELLEKFHISGMKMVGDRHAPVQKVAFIMHAFGTDNDTIAFIEKEKIDAVIALELVDFTVTEYIRDCCMLNQPKAILAVGHFNVEEPGMEYMLEYLPNIVENSVPCHFVESADMYDFLVHDQK